MCAMNSACLSTGLAVIERDYPGLVRQFARMLRNRVLAEDLVNDAVAETLAKLHGQLIEEPERLGGFIYAVAVNLLKNHRRRICNRGDLRVAIFDDLPAGGDPTECLDRTQLAARVWKVIEELPMQRDREIVKRFYLDEEEKESICADLDLTPGHFDRVAFRARQRMKVLLSREELRQEPLRV